MIVRSIHIKRADDYGYGAFNPTKPMLATVAVEGPHGKVELIPSEDLSRNVVEIIAGEIAAAGRATAEAMTADILTLSALPAPEAA